MIYLFSMLSISKMTQQHFSIKLLVEILGKAIKEGEFVGWCLQDHVNLSKRDCDELGVLLPAAINTLEGKPYQLSFVKSNSLDLQFLRFAVNSDQGTLMHSPNRSFVAYVQDQKISILTKQDFLRIKE